MARPVRRRLSLASDRRLFSAMLAKIQSISLQKDLELMGSDPFYMFDSSNLVYVIFLLVGIVGFL